MILCEDVQTRLKNRCGGKFREIALADDFLAAQAALRATPSLYVLPAANQVGPNTPMTGAIRQRITQVFTLAMIFGTAGGKTDLTLIQQHEVAVVDAMVGWTPPGAVHFFTYRGGRLLAVNPEKATCIWGSDFAAGNYLTKGTI
jgi:hypothetical protein